MRANSVGVPSTVVPALITPPRTPAQNDTEANPLSTSLSDLSFEDGSNQSPRDTIDLSSAAAAGYATPPSNPNPSANPTTDQAPDASSLVGVSVYNYAGKVGTLHPGAGTLLNVAA